MLNLIKHFKISKNHFILPLEETHRQVKTVFTQRQLSPRPVPQSVRWPVPVSPAHRRSCNRWFRCQPPVVPPAQQWPQQPPHAAARSSTCGTCPACSVTSPAAVGAAWRNAPESRVSCGLYIIDKTVQNPQKSCKNTQKCTNFAINHHTW